MRNRILGVLAALIAVIGLSATSASASASPAAGPVSWCNPSCHLWANDNHGEGIYYPGIGNYVYVNYPAGTSTVYSIGVGVEVKIRNHNGNCLQMDDAAQGYAVREEACESGNQAQLFTMGGANNVYTFVSVRYPSEFLATDCSTAAGDYVFGEADKPGTCVGWWSP